MNKKLINKSLVNKSIWTSILFITILVVGILVLRDYQLRLEEQYDEKLNDISEHTNALLELESLLSHSLFEVRGYFAFGVDSFLIATQKNEQKIEKLLNDLPEESVLDADYRIYEEIREFKKWYFEDTLPVGIQYKQEGNEAALVQLSQNGGATETINNFWDELENEIKKLQMEREQLLAEKESKMVGSQNVFFFFLMCMVVVLLFLFWLLVRRVILPIKGLALTADEISNGHYMNMLDYTEKEDEIGALARSFEKMVRDLQSNEQTLVAQNEELIAQQDELNEQQEKLQGALAATKENEAMLMRRNQFIRTLANTLNKDELLNNVIDSIVHFTKAAKGIVMLVNEEKNYASHGLTKEEAAQFLHSFHDSSAIMKLQRTMKPYVVKRESMPGERGYVTEPYFCYDLILPIFHEERELMAIIMVTRLGEEFTENQIEEYTGFSKQISLSLEKLYMYEQTENNRQTVQDILNTIHEGIQLFNEHGQVSLVNQTFCEIIGEERDALLLRKSTDEWMALLQEKVENPEELIAFIKNAIYEQPQSESFIFKLNGEKARIIQLYPETLYRDKHKFGTIFVYRDITKQYEVDQMKSEFVSTVSHELRTPLSSVLGFTELMLNKELPPQRQRKYLMTISQEASRLTSLINDFLDVQRMESGKQTYNKNYYCISEIIQESLAINEVNTKIHDFIVDVQTPNLTVLGDKDKLVQVFNNLLSNAVKYSPNGGKITIKLREEQSSLKIDVIDEGLGIPPEALSHLFTKFYRIDNTDRRKIGGTGLGLAIVKEIVKAHDGDIEVTSTFGEGSVFTVSLPLIEDVLIPHNEADDTRYKADVVIVEDDRSLASLLHEELKDNGFRVFHYTDGETAVSAITEQLPDAIVVDIMLDNSIDGWAIIKKLKENPKTEKIPIFISTALDEQEKGGLLGAEGYLVKPYQPSKLSNSILQVLLENERKGQILIPNPDQST